jgi:ubiquinone/menaquinone biosynthesis C-methylase UbiE
MDHHHDVGRFDEWAPTYEQHWLQRRFFGPLQGVALDMASAQVAAPKAVLDVGCGTGRLLRALEARFPGALVEGVDAAPAMVKQAMALLPEGSRIHVQEATAERLPFPDETFDLVFSTMTFHHWSDQAKGAAEVRRVMTAGGCWILADFVATGLVGVVTRLVSLRRFPRRTHLDALLAGAGMHVIESRAVPGTMGNVPVMAIGGSVAS